MTYRGRKFRPWVVKTIDFMKGALTIVMMLFLVASIFLGFFGAVFQEQDKLASMVSTEEINVINE